MTLDGMIMKIKADGATTNLAVGAGVTKRWYYDGGSDGQGTGAYPSPYMINAGSYSFYWELKTAATGTFNLEVGICNSDGSGYTMILQKSEAFSGTSGTIQLGTADWQDVSGKRLCFKLTPSVAITIKIGRTGDSLLYIPTTAVPEGTLLFLLIAPTIPLLVRKSFQKKKSLDKSNSRM